MGHIRQGSNHCTTCIRALVLCCRYVLPLFIALTLDVRNILNVLHDPDTDFSDADWELLGQQLIRGSLLRTIRADRNGDPSLCLIDTVSTWLQTDPEASWEKLAQAIEKVARYGEKTGNTVRQKAGMCVWE